MRNVLFWGLLPFLAPQALYVRRTAPRFAAAGGPDSGRVGDGSPLRLLAVGDSIIAGVGARRLDNALVGRTAASLGQTLDVSVQWRAFGGVGYKSGQIIDEFLPKLPSEPADFIIVSVGVNDITGLTSLTRWRDNLSRLIGRLTEHSPDASIGISGIPPLGVFPLLPQPLRATAGLRATSFDRAARAVIASHSNCVHVPINIDTGPDGFAADGYHPSEDSYRVYGEEMARSLLSLR